MGVAIITIFLLALLSLFCRSLQVAQPLEVGFYRNTCEVAESIVREEVINAFFRNKGIAAGLVRLHFHDCFVRGCDASILINSTQGNVAEMDAPPNGISLRGLEVIDRAKLRLEDKCKGLVSCADILAFAARDVVQIVRTRDQTTQAGRRDGRISVAAETMDIPAPFLNLDQTTQAFAKKNLTQEEMVILQGSHTIGRSHCTSFSNRLYNFSATRSQDPSLNPLLAGSLRLQCPRNQQGTVDPNLVVQMNLTPNLLENSYYKDVLLHNVLFTSDQTLTTSPDTLSLVKDYASNNTDWLIDFANAMVKMSKIEVLTGTEGEIRENCRVINP